MNRISRDDIFKWKLFPIVCFQVNQDSRRKMLSFESANDKLYSYKWILMANEPPLDYWWRFDNKMRHLRSSIAD